MVLIYIYICMEVHLELRYIELDDIYQLSIIDTIMAVT